ncbi:hypothetical protein N7495_003070 [Penicillium taxi]|uniref:uncharacterized protein n=1 Tax=Penicillium taxi TaxID=168475 RepID=UPI002545454C|nr:uncharacterized protein N7495_003070 [Penicillium taxi]KAJ5902542.1 hypothetical protein N7495_003070 [Penicillium taxi]
MRNLVASILTTSLLLSSACAISHNPPGRDAILLSNVQTLTLRTDRLTTSRRVSPIPQLSCVGPSKKICNLYKPEIIRCTNQGYDYDEEDVQWTCTASLPEEFKLGATDVICEGYRSAEDKWVLKGSCGVEYRMMLTEEGERRFGKSDNVWSSGHRAGKLIGNIIFFGIFFAVFILIISSCLGFRGNDRPRDQRRGWGWGGGGDYPGGPPPPYSSSDGRSFGSQGWRPGFWTGALGGTAAGYQMGRRSGNSYQGSSFGRFNDPGEGSSRSRSSPSFSSTSASTGFGSTRRR